MNTSRRRINHLSTVRTARSVAGLFIFTGFLMLILSAAVGTLLFQTDIKGGDVDAVLDSLSPETELSVPGQIEAAPSETRLDVIKASLDTQGLLASVGDVISELKWNDLWKLLFGAFVILWLGYVLRVMAVLAETQLVDFHHSD